MELAWRAPRRGTAKINVHFVQQTDVPLNGNLNGAGVIVRDHYGRMLWGAAGPMHELSELQSSLWGIQMGMMAAYNKGFNVMEVETVSREAYDVIDLQQFIVVLEAVSHVVKQFNTRQTNFFEEGETECVIAVVPVSMNGTAEYIATYGMRHMSSFELTPRSFADLQTHLDRDMGMEIPEDFMATGTAFGQGEVVDVATP